MEQLRLGIIGAGPIVEKKHLPALAEVPEIAVVTVCRRSEQPLRQLAGRFRIPKWCTDYRDVLDDREVDAVLIASGPESQPAIIKDAAAVKKHVFVDKPMADSAAQARDIAAAVRAAGIHLQIGFNKRFYYGYREAKRLLEAGELGPLSAVSARFWYQAGRRDPLLYNGIHFLDLTEFFAGRVGHVFARSHAMPSANGGPGMETLAISMVTDGGVVANLLLSSAASWDFINEHVDLIGAGQGALSIENGRQLRVFRKETAAASRLHENTLSVHWWSGHDEQGFAPQLRVFAGHALGRDRPGAATDPPTARAAGVEEGIRSLAVLEAIRRSLAQGASVPVAADTV